MKKIFIITGEYSGDIHASNVVKELRALNSDIQIECPKYRELTDKELFSLEKRCKYYEDLSEERYYKLHKILENDEIRKKMNLISPISGRKRVNLKNDLTKKDNFLNFQSLSQSESTDIGLLGSNDSK